MNQQGIGESKTNNALPRSIDAGCGSEQSGQARTPEVPTNVGTSWGPSGSTFEGRLYAYLSQARSAAEASPLQEDAHIVIGALLDSDRLGKFIDSLDEYIFIKDTGNQIIRVNQAVANAMGTTPEAMAGSPTSDWYPQHADQYFVDDLEVMRQQQPITGIVEPHFAAKDGDPRRILTDKFPLMNRSGETVGVLVVTRDLDPDAVPVTVGPATENESASPNRITATADFARDVSRVLEDVLATIVGYSDLISLEANRGRDVAPFVRSLGFATSNASDVIRSLQRFASNDTTHLEPIDLGDVLIESYPTIRTMIPSRIKLDWQISDQGMPIEGDAARIEELLAILVANAVESIKQEGIVTVETTIRTAYTARSEPHSEIERPLPPGVTLTVADTGTGIPDAVRKNIFHRYATTKNDRLGRGLGLCTAKLIVHHHGGEIVCETEMGEGTTFRIHLPFR